MNLAYITSFKSSDIHEWSGSIYHIHQALQHSNFRTEYIDNLKNRGEFSLKIRKPCMQKLLVRHTCAIEELRKFMGDLSYVLWAVLPGFMDSHSGQMLQVDGIFTRVDKDA